MSYPWTPQEVFALLGETPQRVSSDEVYVSCPFCQSSKKKFAMNLTHGMGHCFVCNASADTASYYAAQENLSVREAREEIKRRLNIKDFRTEKMPERNVIASQEQSEMAKIEVLDFTYRSFLAELTLSEKNYNMLLARGFSDSDIKELNYKTFPGHSEIDFVALCRRLQTKGCTLKGVPGFYQTKTGDWTFVRITKGIIIPQKTINNQIFGFQIRKDDDLRSYNEETGELEPKCVWFSSKNCRNGCKSMAEVNYSCDFKFDKGTQKSWPYFKTKKVLLTEGAMKADLIHAFEPELPVISVAGVNSTSYLENTLKILKKLGVESVLHAYDMDYHTNESVQKQMEKTKSIIVNTGMNYKMLEWNTKVSVDGQDVDILKGLDDYMAYIKKGIIPKIKKMSNDTE